MKELLIMAGLVPFNRRRNELENGGPGNLYNMLDDFFAEGWPSARRLAADTFKLDVREDEKAYYVEAELPGVKKDEVQVIVDEDRKLLISVERVEETEDNQKNYIHRERSYSSMQRNIYLVDADTQGVKATLQNGVLHIIVNKAPKKETKRLVEIE
jgi:HSP20 family protein